MLKFLKNIEIFEKYWNIWKILIFLINVEFMKNVEIMEKKFMKVSPIQKWLSIAIELWEVVRSKPRQRFGFDVT